MAQPRISASRRSDGSANISVRNGPSGFYYTMPPEEVDALLEQLLGSPVVEEWGYLPPGGDEVRICRRKPPYGRDDAHHGAKANKGKVMRRWRTYWTEEGL